MRLLPDWRKEEALRTEKHLSTWPAHASSPAHRSGWRAALALMGILLMPALANAACTEVRVRKEWLALSSAERRSFLQAVRKLQVRPARGQPSKYDQLVKLYADHYEAMSASAAFLPWHRHYLHVFEQELRKLDPTVTLPYWDWSAHSQYAERHMATMYAPSDPLFFLHHAFVDKLWADWQTLEPEHWTAYGGENKNGSLATLQDTLPGFPDITVQSVIKTQSLCYTYR